MVLLINIVCCTTLVVVKVEGEKLAEAGKWEEEERIVVNQIANKL